MPRAPATTSLQRRPARRALTPAERKARLRQRDAWLRQIDPASLFFPLFDLLPGVAFFAKNRDGELMLMSRANRDVYGLPDDASVIGHSDESLNPPDMAHAYMLDDQRVLATGEPVLDRVELWFNEHGIPDWSVVSKLPIRARDGSIAGVMGISQTFERRAQRLEPFGGLSKVVGYVREHYAEPLPLALLARIGGFSARQLQRKFRQVLGLGPHDFIVKTRLVAASRAIRGTARGLREIAIDAGFCDQSALTHHFREHLGVTPRLFRLRLGPA